MNWQIRGSELSTSTKGGRIQVILKDSAHVGLRQGPIATYLLIPRAAGASCAPTQSGLSLPPFSSLACSAQAEGGMLSFHKNSVPARLRSRRG